MQELHEEAEVKCQDIAKSKPKEREYKTAKSVDDRYKRLVRDNKLWGADTTNWESTKEIRRGETYSMEKEMEKETALNH